MATINAGKGNPVAIFNRNQPVFYCVPAELYEQMHDAVAIRNWLNWSTNEVTSLCLMWIWMRFCESYRQIQRRGL